MKVHTCNNGDLAAEHDLATGLPYFERIYICREVARRASWQGAGQSLV